MSPLDQKANELRLATIAMMQNDLSFAIIRRSLRKSKEALTRAQEALDRFQKLLA